MTKVNWREMRNEHAVGRCWARRAREEDQKGDIHAGGGAQPLYVISGILTVVVFTIVPIVDIITSVVPALSWRRIRMRCYPIEQSVRIETNYTSNSSRRDPNHGRQVRATGPHLIQSTQNGAQHGSVSARSRASLSLFGDSSSPAQPLRQTFIPLGALELRKSPLFQDGFQGSKQTSV